MHAYIKGIDFDIHHQVMKQLFSSFGDVAAVKLLRGCLHVTCLTDRQRQQLLTAKDLDGKMVEVTELFHRLWK